MLVAETATMNVTNTHAVAAAGIGRVGNQTQWWECGTKWRESQRLVFDWHVGTLLQNMYYSVNQQRIKMLFVISSTKPTDS